MDEEKGTKNYKKIASSFVREMIKQNLTYSECRLVIIHMNESLNETKPTLSNTFNSERFLEKLKRQITSESDQNSQ